MCSGTLLGAPSCKATRNEVSLPEITICGCHLEETSQKEVEHVQATTQLTVGDRRSKADSLNVQNTAPACVSSRSRCIELDVQADRDLDIAKDIVQAVPALVDYNGLPSEIAQAAVFFKLLGEIRGGPEYHSRLVTLSRKIRGEHNALSRETVLEDDAGEFGHAGVQTRQATTIRYIAKGKAKLISFDTTKV